MDTVMIPKNITKGEDLVVIPRKLYEQFVRAMKRQSAYSTLDPGLQEALQDVRSGHVSGPFSSVKEGFKS